jgi:DNA-directed RNA polymerase specialized sigma24 family protein
MIGDIPEYKLEKFIQGIVAKLIRSYKMTDFVIQAPSGRIDSDFRSDMIQAGWVAALECQRSHPKESKNPHYLRRAVVNSLLKYEKADRRRRDSREEVFDETIPAATKSNDAADVDRLITKAELTPSELCIVELFYGLRDGGEHTVEKISRLMDKPVGWVNQRLSVAKIKLQVAAGR